MEQGYKFCTNCGAKMKVMDRFCTKCGTRCDAESPAAATAVLDEAEQRRMMAQQKLMLGIQTLDGQGVSQDYIKAQQLFQEAVSLGNTGAADWMRIAQLTQLADRLRREAEDRNSTAGVQPVPGAVPSAGMQSAGGALPLRDANGHLVAENTHRPLASAGGARPVPMHDPAGHGGQPGMHRSSGSGIGKFAAGAAVGAVAGAVLGGAMGGHHGAAASANPQNNNNSDSYVPDTDGSSDASYEAEPDSAETYPEDGGGEPGQTMEPDGVTEAGDESYTEENPEDYDTYDSDDSSGDDSSWDDSSSDDGGFFGGDDGGDDW